MVTVALAVLVATTTAAPPLRLRKMVLPASAAEESNHRGVFDNFLERRVHKKRRARASKKKAASVSVFVWSEALSTSEVGHASLWMDSSGGTNYPTKDDNNDYVSWWPQYGLDSIAAVRPAVPNDICFDLANENPPYTRVDITANDCLDQAAMKAFYATKKASTYHTLCQKALPAANRNNGKCETVNRRWVLKAANQAEETERYSFYGEAGLRSCSSMAYEVLKAGGSDAKATINPAALKTLFGPVARTALGIGEVEKEKKPWKPSDVLALARALVVACGGSETAVAANPVVAGCAAAVGAKKKKLG